MLTVSQLYIYPVKSLGGIAVEQSEVTDRGLEYDRRWVLVDEQHQFLTQRNHPQMALFKLDLADGGFNVTFKPDGSSLFISFQPQSDQPVQVTIWDDLCAGVPASADADEWFSEKLNFKCRLIYMNNASERPVDERYAKHREIVSFADAYPFLIIGQRSLDELNSRLSDQVTMDRFRPNIVFTGAEAHYEDRLARFKIHDIDFWGIKPCARCVMIGIDQQTAQSNKEPTKTLARYRSWNKKIYFGQNLVHKGSGSVRVGDELQVLQEKVDFILQPFTVPLQELAYVHTA